MPRVNNEQFYAASLRKHGVSAQGVQWRSVENQRIRFEQIVSMILREGETLRIVDAGCGFGDLYRYLVPIAGERLHYIGLDSYSVMAEIARKRTQGEIRCLDVLHDPLPMADYYVCSGALNILTPYESHRFIRRCFEASERGFVFNFLEGSDESETYNYLHARTIEALARDLNARCVLKRGYLKDDCTAAFYKVPQTKTAT